jgi:hypothetical protein
MKNFIVTFVLAAAIFSGAYYVAVNQAEWHRVATETTVPVVVETAPATASEVSK